MKIAILLSIFLVVNLEAARLKTTNDRPKLLINGRPAGGLVPKHKFVRSEIVDNGPSNDQYITQPLDHFNRSNTNTFQQRYWYNQDWLRGTNKAVFLNIEGDAPADNRAVSSGSGLLFTQFAVNFGALAFSLEHRYYGASNGTPDLSTPNLKYLSARQAIGDIAYFIKEMNTQFNLTGYKWVIFGGSYAGALTVWSKQLYPELMMDVVAFSAMVQAVVDNVGYLQVVEQVLKSSNSDCGNSLQEGLKEIEEMTRTANGRQKLFKGFELCEPLNVSNKDQMSYFYSKILDPYMYGVQYGEYANLCNVLTDTTATILANMYKVNRLFNVNTSCLDINYNSYIQYLQNTDLDNADRAWFYQTCNEFGFYQTTDNNYDFYGNIIPIDWYVKQCRDVFGSAFDNSTVYSNIAYTNVLFHGQNGYHGLNTMLTYGTADPWHVLGVLSQNGPFPIMMNGTYHCAAMGEMNKTSDPPELWDVKYLIQELILCDFMDNIC